MARTKANPGRGSRPNTSTKGSDASSEKPKKGKQKIQPKRPKPRRSVEVTLALNKRTTRVDDQQEDEIKSVSLDDKETQSPPHTGGLSKEDLLSSLSLSDKKRLKALEDEPKQPTKRTSSRTRTRNVRLREIGQGSRLGETGQESRLGEIGQGDGPRLTEKGVVELNGKESDKEGIIKNDSGSDKKKTAYVSDFEEVSEGAETLVSKSSSKNQSQNPISASQGKGDNLACKDNSADVISIEISDNTSENDNSLKSKSKQQNGEKEVLEESFDATSLSTSTPIAHRSRGRKRRGRGISRGTPRIYLREKRVNNSSKNSESFAEESNRSLRTSSRKRKQKTYSDSVDVDSDEVEEEEGKSEEEEEVEYNQSKRKKISQSDEEDTVKGSTRRGRPRGGKKQNFEDDKAALSGQSRGGRRKRNLDESDEGDYTPTAKKGCPKKTKIKSPEIVASTLCVRCGKDLSTLAGLKFHLMTVHQALWYKDCPEGKTDPASLKRIIKAQGKLVCQKCKKELKHYHYYVHHIKWCGREDERTVCEVCGRSQKSMWYHAHLVFHKKKEEDAKAEAKKGKPGEEKGEDGEELNRMGKTKRQSAKKAMKTLAEIGEEETKSSRGGRRKGNEDDDEFIGDDSDADKDFDDEEDDTDEEDNHLPARKSGNFNQGKKYMRPESAIFFKDKPDFYMEILERQREATRGTLFPKHIPRKSNWMELPQAEALKHVSEKESIPFIVKQQKKASGVQQLRVAQSWNTAGQSTCYTGYSIWGLAWCPTPYKKSASQFAAVACNLSYDHPTNKTFSEPGLIQIWDFGELSCEKNAVADPKLAFTIAHDFGCVWQVCWCPRGVWEEPIVTLDDTQEDLPRLGLLAVGCSDGTVRIFSIPHPQFLSATSDLYFPTDEQLQKGRTPPVYKAMPCLSLVNRPNSDTGCCLCIDWQKAGNSQLLLGGYSQGLVQIWDLDTTSPLLRVLNSEGETILPLQVIPTHRRAVTGCSWSETVPLCFATVGRDKLVSFWNANSPHRPYDRFTSSEIGVMTCAKWAGPMYCGIVVAQDDCMHLNHNGTHFQESGHSGPRGFFDKPLGIHNSVVWDLSFCPEFNVLLSCDGSGCVVAVKAVDLRIPSVKFTKGPPRCKSILFTSKLLTSMSVEVKVEEDTPAEISEPCLEFDDNEHIHQIRTLSSKDDIGYKMPSLSVGDCVTIPLQSVNRIAVNPNIESCTWSLSGTNAGFLRLHNLHGMMSTSAKHELAIS